MRHNANRRPVRPHGNIFRPAIGTNHMPGCRRNGIAFTQSTGEGANRYNSVVRATVAPGEKAMFAFGQ